MNAAFAWYHKTTEPQSLLIGPAGHGNAEWRELEAVVTPQDRRANPFYMEAEAQCVIARHGLRLAPLSVQFAVPGVKIAPGITSPEFFKAYDQLRAKFETASPRQ